MAVLTFTGYSDDIVDFDGVFSEEFYVDGDGEWLGRLVAPDGRTAVLRASIYKDNLHGWFVQQLGEYVFPYTVDTRYNEGYADDEDYVMILDVPEGSFVEELE